MTLEEELIGFVEATSFSDIPREAIEASRREVLWTLGSCVAGAGAPGSDRIIAFVRQVGGQPEATVIGFGDRVAATVAGLANGAFAKALEYEDKLWIDLENGAYKGAYAIATAVVPAAFAVAEHMGGVDGKAFLRAVTLATDIQGRLVKSIPNSIYTGWSSTNMFSTFGAALVAGVLLGLTERQLLDAMGLAYAQAAGNYQGHEEEEEVLGVRMEMGFGVRNGITAAQLAKLGISGAKHFLTGKHGLYGLFYKGEELDMEAVTKDLGRRFSGTRIGFKAYPCCAHLHAPIDAVLSLLGHDSPSLESIESIRVFAPSRIKRVVEPQEARQNPRTVVDTQFSIPWTLACALVDHKVSLRHFTEEALGDHRYIGLARKVEVDLHADRQGVSMEIKLKDGRTLRSPTVARPRGHPDNPLSMEEMVDRFWECGEFAPHPIARERASLAKDLVLRLEEVDDIAEIVRLLS